MLFVLPVNLWAGKLDIDYIHPSPSGTAAAAMLVPGGGWFYLSANTKEPRLKSPYFYRGVLYIALTATTIIFSASQIKQKNTPLTIVGLASIVCVRFSDIFSSVSIAEQERFINSDKVWNP